MTPCARHDSPPQWRSGAGTAGPQQPQSGQLHPGQRVRVHVNLHKQRLSVIDPRAGRVITYVDDITLTDVRFRHQPACVEKVRARGVRAVCAYAIGMVEAVNTHPPEVGRRVRYNPFTRPDFHDADTGDTVTHADRVVFTNLRAYAVTA